MNEIEKSIRNLIRQRDKLINIESKNSIDMAYKQGQVEGLNKAISEIRNALYREYNKYE